MPVLPQVVIFVKSVQRCIALAQLLVEQNFPAIAIHRGMPQEERWVGGACVPARPSGSCPVEEAVWREESLNPLIYSLTKALSVSAVQGFSAEDSCGYQPVWPRHGY